MIFLFFRLLDFSLFWIILSLFGPYRAKCVVGVGSLYSRSLMYFEFVVGLVMGWVVFWWLPCLTQLFSCVGVGVLLSQETWWIDNCTFLTIHSGPPTNACMTRKWCWLVLGSLATLPFLLLSYTYTQNVGGPHLWEALGPGLLGLCLKRALTKTLFKFKKECLRKKR